MEKNKCYLSRIIGSEERVRSTGVVRATRPSDTMHIVLRVVGIVIVYHKLHVFHICVQAAVLAREGVEAYTIINVLDK